MARCKWIDSTVWIRDGYVETTAGLVKEDEWNACIREHFERYAYGREVAPTTGKTHFQFRGVLKTDLSNALLVTLGSYGFRNVTPTHVRDFEYVYKDKDFYCSWDTFRPEYKHIRDRPYTYQVQLNAMERDDRTIEIVVDEVGNSGKTAWAMYQDYLHKAVYIPPLKRGLDLVACVLGKRESDWYIVDTPRAFEFTDDWACSLEQLKNGYVFDTRYSFRDKVLQVRPRITVLCNNEPDFEKYFSKDRVSLFGLEKVSNDYYLWNR